MAEKQDSGIQVLQVGGQQAPAKTNWPMLLLVGLVGVVAYSMWKKKSEMNKWYLMTPTPTTLTVTKAIGYGEWWLMTPSPYYTLSIGNQGVSNIRITSYPTTPIPAGIACPIRIVFTYIGPATTLSVRGSLGEVSTTFNNFVEKQHKDMTMTVGSYTTATDLFIDVEIPTDGLGNQQYSLQATVSGVSTNYDAYTDVIDITNTGGISNLRVSGFPSTVVIGQNCNGTLMFDYQGSGGTSQSYEIALGRIHPMAGFVKESTKTGTVTLPSSPSFPAPVSVSVSLPTTGLVADEYSLKAWVGSLDMLFDGPTMVNPNIPVVTDVAITSWPTAPLLAGQVCTIQIRFTYTGPATTLTARGAIGQISDLNQNIAIKKYTDFSVGVTASTVPDTGYVSVSIPTDGLANGFYSLQATVNGVTTGYNDYREVISINTTVQTGAIVSPYLGDYSPAGKYWWASFNDRYFANFLGVTTDWDLRAYDFGTTGESGIMIVEVYDVNYQLLGAGQTYVTIRNGKLYGASLAYGILTVTEMGNF